MSNTRLLSFLSLAALIFAVVAGAHVWRLLSATTVVIGGATVPMAVSWVGLVVAGGMSLWAITLTRAVARGT
jgi:hypothetical protein